MGREEEFSGVGPALVWSASFPLPRTTTSSPNGTRRALPLPRQARDSPDKAQILRVRLYGSCFGGAVVVCMYKCINNVCAVTLFTLPACTVLRCTALRWIEIWEMRSNPVLPPSPILLFPLGRSPGLTRSTTGIHHSCRRMEWNLCTPPRGTPS